MTTQPYPYRAMFEVEDRLWWYRGLRLFYEQALRRAGVRADAVVLDAGCGTGANLAFLAKRFATAIGCDFGAEAVRLCAGRGLKRVVVSDVNELPFRSGTFDLVLSSDVFESREVDEHRAVAELVRVTRPGARIVLTAAAHDFLLSEHDRAFHTVRRFTKRHARQVFGVPGLEIVAMRYLFGAFFVPIVAYRLVKRLWRSPASVATAHTDLFLPPSPVNAAMAAVARAEAALARIAHLPFGTTLLVEMRRV